jgi:ATP-dependent DNA helicase PIF1
MATIHFSDE